MRTETQLPVQLTGEAARIVARYRKVSQGGFQTWFEIIMGCFGGVAIKDVWPLLIACGEVADEMRAEVRDRLASQRLIDTVPRWQPLMAYFGRHMAEFRGDLQQKQQHSQRLAMPAHATACDDSGSMVLSIDGRKPLALAELSDGLRSDAMESVALEEASESGERSICYQTEAAKTSAKMRLVEQPAAIHPTADPIAPGGRLAAGARGVIIASSSK